MNKLKLAKQAQKLYEIENLNADEIALKLGISRRTVFNWIKQFNWKKHKMYIAEIKNSFPQELQQLASKMMTKVNNDIDNKRKLSNEELYSIASIVETLDKMEKQKTKYSSPKDEPKGLTHEKIKEIQRDILGWEY